MPLRVIAYDGASYKKQIIDKKERAKSNKAHAQSKFYPVITLVVYMGDKPWNKNVSLHEVLDIKPELRPFVNDYKAHVIDLSRLKKKDIELFDSDFRSLIDWVQKKRNSDYKIKDRVLDHPLEMRQLLYELSGDERLYGAYSDEEAEQGEQITMCEFIDRLQEEGKTKIQMQLLADLVKDGLLSLQQAAERVGMTVAKFKATAKKLGICL